MNNAETRQGPGFTRHTMRPARSALTCDQRAHAALLATQAEVRGERDLAAGLRNLARTAPRAGCCVHIVPHQASSATCAVP